MTLSSIWQVDWLKHDFILYLITWLTWHGLFEILTRCLIFLKLMCLPNLTSCVPWPCFYLCFWQVEWLGHVFTCVSDKLSDLAMCLPVFLTSKETFYLCFWQVELLGHVFTCVSDKLSDLTMCLPEFLTSWVTWACVYLSFWQVEWLGHVFICVSDK